MKPVYVINGFLESGKTEFISFTLAQPYFQIRGTTLLILCEEGENEYDEALLKKSPEALFDIHRDGVSAEEYETEVEGEEISKVRLFVGRSNANREANMAFAKKLKKAADAEYPGLVKDIYMGKGNYNQELYPQALLLEFGTHEIEKDKVMESTGYMAKVVDQVLGGTASAEKDAGETKGSAKAIVWVILLAVVAAGVYALAATGRMGDVWGKMKRSLSELTGGSAGKRK